ncbi:MAG: metallophosphoesterase, partial [Actinomycetota bacterium]
LDPRQLMTTAFRVVVSGVFGTWADKRELQAALSATGVGDRSQGAGLWIDYVADLGDGFDPTYTVARLLAGKRLELSWQATLYPTERGQILVMGGDQVYPTATTDEYESRLIGPYRAALPVSLPESGHPQLLAIPGNHDWYDGLTSFIRIFCQGSWIGGWKTAQTRSYFAVKLPHRWWLWGIDIQLDTYVDHPQMDYFKKVVAPEVEPGDRIILCNAIPAWLHAGDSKEHASFRNLRYFERHAVQPTGARVALYLSGDWHHYARYEGGQGTSQRITAGGGGAFLYPTHRLPERLELEEDGGVGRYQLKTTYPTRALSKRLRRGLWRLPARNIPFAVTVGITYLALAWMVLIGLSRLGVEQGAAARSLALRDLGIGLARSPVAILALGGLVGGLVGYAKGLQGPRRWALGITHAAGHVAVVAGLMLGASRVISGLEGAAAVVGFLVAVGVVGAVAGSFVMAAYLWMSNRFLGMHN